MRTPTTEGGHVSEDSFSSAHESMRSGGRTGTVEASEDETGAVFLNGVVVYARHLGEGSVDALDSLSSDQNTEVHVRTSQPRKVRMFRTYMRYLGDDGLVDAEPLDGESLDIQRVEGVLVGGVRNLAAASWRGESDTSDRTFFPDGERTVLIPDLVSLRRYVAENELTGYAAGDGNVVTFRNGELVDGASVDLDTPVRSEVNAGGGWVVVDSEADDDNEENSDGGLLSRLL